MWLMNGTTIVAAANLPGLALSWGDNAIGDFSGTGKQIFCGATLKLARIRCGK
jgi:hypothetical protein